MAPSSIIQARRLTKPFSLAAFLLTVIFSTHFFMLAVLAARELSTAGDDKAMRGRHEKWMAEHGRTNKDSAEKARARRFEALKSNAHFRRTGGSAVAAVEGIHAIRTGNVVSLSEQQLVDCSTGGHNSGCNLGDMDEAFRYITSSGGIDTEQAYGYEARQSSCRSSGKQAAAVIRGLQYVPSRNETALMLAVAHQPVSVALDSKNRMFYLFQGNGMVFGASGEQCSTDLNHAVTIVGYGTDEHGTKYWLAKNSWGTDWADQGYVKIARDVASSTGLCCLAMQASYPVA